MKSQLTRFLSLVFIVTVLVGCAAPASPTTAPTQAAPTAAATESAPSQAAPTQATSAQAAPTDASVTEAAPTADAATPDGDTPTLNVMTHDSFAVSEAVVQKFEQDNHVKINFIKSGDVGAALNQAILSKGSPLADVFYGVDNTFLSRALKEDIFESYASPALENVDAAFKLDAENRALPVDYGDVCINFDKAYFTEKNLAVPQTLDDLRKPEYKGLLVTENPATSSPGLAFLMATIAQYGQDGYIQYWKDLRANGLVVVSGWEAAYYTNFSGSSGKGPQPLVVSYSSSPVVEVVYAENPPADAPTGSVVGDNTCFRQVEFVGILKGTQQRALAEKFVDFMLSEPFQEDMPLQMFVYPVNKNAKLPEAFQKFSQTSEKPAMLDPQLIADNRDAWIQAWTDAVLR
jgi:thiamine transport system substrate-binding protein